MNMCKLPKLLILPQGCGIPEKCAFLPCPPAGNKPLSWSRVFACFVGFVGFVLTESRPNCAWLQVDTPDGIFPLVAVVSQLPVRHTMYKKGLPVGSQTNSRLPQRLWWKDKGNIPSVSLSRSWLGKADLELEPVPQSQGFWLLGTWLFPIGCGC